MAEQSWFYQCFQDLPSHHSLNDESDFKDLISQTFPFYLSNRQPFSFQLLLLRLVSYQKLLTMTFLFSMLLPAGFGEIIHLDLVLCQLSAVLIA